MSFDILQEIVQSFWSFIHYNGYVLAFFLMLIEGPIATYVAAFAASAGLLNIYIIFILAVFGNLIPDCFFFFVGRHSRVKAVESFLETFWINKSRIKKIERGLHKHIKKSIVVLKLTPGLGIPGILLAGFTKVPFRKFFMISLIFNMISALIFCTLGFYSGIAVGTLFKYLRLEEYVVLALIALTVLVYFFIKFIYKKFKNGY